MSVRERRRSVVLSCCQRVPVSHPAALAQGSREPPPGAGITPWVPTPAPSCCWVLLGLPRQLVVENED